MRLRNTTLAFAAGALAAGLLLPHATTFHAHARVPTQSAPAANTATIGLPDFSALVEREGSAVVNISTVERASPASAQTRQGVGSGFVISPDGYILTNAHVVAGSREVTVRLTDKRELKATVVGLDRRTDVALLKVNATGLPAVKIGNPERLKVGEWVAAIGSPFGFESSVTAGIVSAKSRALPGDGFVPFIQSDVAINPGNSGGPLFNLAGEVIGINSQIYSRSGGYQGLAFAIPIDVAIKVKDDLLKYGKVTRGRLGVAIQPLSREAAESFGLAQPAGALIANVEPGGPAASAGLRSGDIVLSVNGKGVGQSGDLPRLIGELRPGDTVTLGIWRDSTKREIRARLTEMPADPVT